MTQLYLHPHIPDHFVEYDMDSVRGSPCDGSVADLRRTVMEDYVAERIIVLRNIKIDYDRAFVQSIEFPHNWTFKKFPCRTVEAATSVADDPAKQELASALFGGDLGRYGYFESQMKLVNAGIRSVLDEILRHHNVTKRDISWRHTETRVENLHFDIDRGADDFESVRLYFNMDDAPRIWHTTHVLTDLLARYYNELGLSLLANEPLERLLHVLSVRVFGNWSSRGREQFPRHAALFEPNDLWLVDGRTVPHQVFYGRRVAATFYRLDKAALPGWHPSLSERLRQIHAQGGVKDREPLDMQGFRYPFEGEGPPPPPNVRRPTDLKTEWEGLYNDSVQEQLVRL
jgi:hypothetical protein